MATKYKWLLGIVLLCVSIGISATGMLRAIDWNTTLASFQVAIAIYICSLILRVLFLKLSAKIIQITANTWSNAVLAVGANAAIMMTATFLAQATSLAGMTLIIVLLLVTIFFAFLIAMRLYRISFLEALSMYAFSLALFAVTFLAFLLLFQFIFGTVFSVPGM